MLAGVTSASVCVGLIVVAFTQRSVSSTKASAFLFTVTLLEGLESSSPGIWVVDAVDPYAEENGAGVLCTLEHTNKSAWGGVVEDYVVFVVRGERGITLRGIRRFRILLERCRGLTVGIDDALAR
jgi:hypothetical protein